MVKVFLKPPSSFYLAPICAPFPRGNAIVPVNADFLGSHSMLQANELF
jgi:hypothetical protein